jgi:protein TonB
MRVIACCLVMACGASVSLSAVGQKAPVRISGGVMAGRIMSKVDPIYPPDARDEKISGSVVLHAIIGTDGAVQDLHVISGPMRLQAAALEAVRQWRYEAYVLNGSTVVVDTTVTVNFSLEK